MIEVNQEETNSFLEETQENQRQVLENLNSSFNGEALQEIVNALEKQPHLSNDELENLRHELTFTRLDFERRLDQDVNSFKIEKLRIKEHQERKLF